MSASRSGAALLLEPNLDFVLADLGAWVMGRYWLEIGWGLRGFWCLASP